MQTGFHGLNTRMVSRFEIVVNFTAISHRKAYNKEDVQRGLFGVFYYKKIGWKVNGA